MHALESAAYAEAYCRASPVDLILMDICTDLGASGLSAKIKQFRPDTKIIIVTSHVETVVLMLRTKD